MPEANISSENLSYLLHLDIVPLLLTQNLNAAPMSK